MSVIMGAGVTLVIGRWFSADEVPGHPKIDRNPIFDSFYYWPVKSQQLPN